ncbi:MAG: hypothetical protein QXG52_09270 [Candidatus Caldarchaeum sp.]
MGKEPSYVDVFRMRGGKSWNINLPPVALARLLQKYCDELSLSADIEDEKNQSRLKERLGKGK